MSQRVLVTDGEQRAALAITRSLGAAGYAVIVAAQGERSLSGASRFCAGRVEVPDPLEAPAEYAARIVELAGRHRVDLVIPVTEAALLALYPVLKEIGNARFPFPSEESFRRISDKASLLAAASGLGLATPRSSVLSTPGEGLAADFRFPLALKSTRSLQEQHGRRSKHGTGYVDRSEDLAAMLRQISSEAFPLLAQERIIGEGIGVFLLRWDGRILARFAHRRLREKPPSGGVSVYCESAAIEPGLLEQCEALLALYDWNGVAMVEFKRDRGTGVPYLMEVNGRFWGSLQLAIDAGVDFPALLASAALGGAPTAIPSYRVGVRSRWLMGDLDHLLIRLRSRDTGVWRPDAPGRIRTAMDILLPGRSPGQNEVWRRDDPRPGRVEAIDWLKNLI